MTQALRGEEAINNFFKHADPNYDPIKAKEYYERTKKLKGRKVGAAPITSARRPGVALTPIKPTAKPAVTPAQQQKAAQLTKVRDMTAKLKELRALLARLVKQAKERSGVEVKKTPAQKAAAEKSKNRTDAEKLSSSEKAKKAKAAKEAYDKENPDKASAELDQKIADVRKKIEAARAKLQKAIEAQAKKPVPTKPKTA